MITRLYANNFRCLVGFEAKFESFGVLCGPNGSGKSSIFDALRLIRNLATGEGYLGGEGERDVASLEFTQWQKSTIQEFELGVTAGGRSFEYVMHLEQKADLSKPCFILERVVCDAKVILERNAEEVRLTWDGFASSYPLDWRQSALASIQAIGNFRVLAKLQDAIANLIILRPNPCAMEPETKSEAKHPRHDLGNIVSWYRSLCQAQEWTDELRELLRGVWPDFRSFRLTDTGLRTKALQLRFEGANGSDSASLYFDQLSDGEKALVGLYMVRAALATGAAQTVLIDEPDNFVGLPELQPWVLSLRELLDDKHQAILISHHPEILSSAGEDFGRYFWRDNHSSPTRMGPMKVPEGLSAGEAIARGWARG